MVSFSKVCLLLTLAAAPVAANLRMLQEEENTMEPQEEASVQLCDGDALAMVANGCTDSEACKLAAEELGLQIGGEDEPFVGNWADKGCYYYPSDHPLYPNQAYFGEQGTCAELRMQPVAGAERVTCDGTTPPPFDPERCPGQLCIDAQGCEEAALAMGLELGSAEYPFEGDWLIKGCVYFPESDPLYPNQAYWGEGASICGQLRAEPTDGSMRITCTGDEEAEAEEEPEVDEEPEAEEVDEETAEEETEPESEVAAPTTEAPVATTEAPVATPVVTPVTAVPLPSNATADDFNATAPASSPAFEDEDDEDNDKDDKDEDDKDEDDKDDKEDDGRGNAISALESDATSSASSNGVHVFFLLSTVITFLSSNL